MDNLQETIESAFDRREELDLGNPAPELREAIQSSIALLDSEGEGDAAKLTVFFEGSGKRKLVAKFANLEVV